MLRNHSFVPEPTSSTLVIPLPILPVMICKQFCPHDIIPKVSSFILKYSHFLSGYILVLHGINDHAFTKFLELIVLQVTINKPMGTTNRCDCAKTEAVKRFIKYFILSKTQHQYIVNNTWFWLHVSVYQPIFRPIFII